MQVQAPGDPNTVLAAIKNAAAVTGSDFHYLLGTALRESSLKTNAQSHSSSAGGLFQFLDQTWLGLIKAHGAKYGLGALAQAIEVGPDGRYRAENDVEKAKILSLKNDPEISALMAGEYARECQGAMASILGRPVSSRELYAAHFLGAEGACKLIRMSESAPASSAASLLPEAASANRGVFFHADGSPKSVREVYDWTVGRPGSVNAPVQIGTAANSAGAATGVNLETLAAEVMNWRPAGFFSGAWSGTRALTLSLGSGLLDLLSSSRDG